MQTRVAQTRRGDLSRRTGRSAAAHPDTPHCPDTIWTFATEHGRPPCLCMLRYTHLAPIITDETNTTHRDTPTAPAPSSKQAREKKKKRYLFNRCPLIPARATEKRQRSTRSVVAPVLSVFPSFHQDDCLRVNFWILFGYSSVLCAFFFFFFLLFAKRLRYVTRS